MPHAPCHTPRRGPLGPLHALDTGGGVGEAPCMPRRTKAAYFSPSLFHFLRELAANNDRAWFLENKAR